RSTMVRGSILGPAPDSRRTAMGESRELSQPDPPLPSGYGGRRTGSPLQRPGLDLLARLPARGERRAGRTACNKPSYLEHDLRIRRLGIHDCILAPRASHRRKGSRLDEYDREGLRSAALGGKTRKSVV